MNFDFDPAQFLFRDNVRRLLAGQWSVARTRTIGETGGHDPALCTRLAELGIAGMLIAEEHGGLGLGILDLVLALEELGAALAPGSLARSVLASEALARFGTAQQQAKYLPALAAGRELLAFAAQEPNAGFDPAEIRMRASALDGGWRLDGRKIMVPYARSATHLLVAARLPDGALALFVCDARARGLTLRDHVLIDPSFAACEIDFDGVQLTAADLLGGGADRGALARLFATGATGAAAEMIGVAGRAFALALDYAKLREQFGRPIGAFQAIKHKLADMYTALESARSAVYYAAWAVTEDAPDAASAVSIAKSVCGDACRLVCNESVQIHGGIGITWAHDLHFYLKRGKVLEYSHGDAAWHREQVARAAIAAVTT